jgi:hypothetical protein
MKSEAHRPAFHDPRRVRTYWRIGLALSPEHVWAAMGLSGRNDPVGERVELAYRFEAGHVPGSRLEGKRGG